MESQGWADSQSDELISLSKAAKLIPGRPSASAIWRWARRGILARSGERLRLEHIRLGTRVYTTEAWVRDFGRRVAEADAHHFNKVVTSNARERSADDKLARLQRIELELKEAGL